VIPALSSRSFRGDVNYEKNAPVGSAKEEEQGKKQRKRRKDGQKGNGAKQEDGTQIP